MTINNLPKKCAACGSEVDIMRIIKKGRGDNPSCVLCERGLHTMVYKTEQEAIDAWNDNQVTRNTLSQMFQEWRQMR